MDYSGARRERNWRRWWFSYLAHFLQGVAVGILVPFPVGAILAFFGYSRYQVVEYERLRDLRDAEHEGKPLVGDWPSIDLMDRLAGLWTGIVIQIIVLGPVLWGAVHLLGWV